MDVVLVIAPDKSNNPLAAESEIEIRDQIKHRGRSTSFVSPPHHFHEIVEFSCSTDHVQYTAKVAESRMINHTVWWINTIF